MRWCGNQKKGGKQEKKTGARTNHNEGPGDKLGQRGARQGEAGRKRDKPMVVYLKADGLAASGGHDHKHIVALQPMTNGLFLIGTEGRVAKHLAQRVLHKR